MDYKKVLSSLGYRFQDNAVSVYIKQYHDNTIIQVDLEQQIIHFGGNIKIYDKPHQHITKPEDRVVFECVDRLLTKGYKATDVSLEKVYPTGRGTSGRLDILVKRDGQSFLMIECKTRGVEFDKEYKKMQKDGGQLFTYFQQDRDSEYLMLYASHFGGIEIQFKNEIVKIEETYRETSNVEDLYIRWNKLTKTNGVFESWVLPYHFESKALTKKDLVKIRQEDSSLIFNRFLEILRHNTVSDKPNAFNKMFTLFLCKIYDEGHKGDDEELEFQYKEGIDDDVSFQVRLTDLYKRGMMEFLRKEITDFNNDDFNKEFGDIDEQTRNKILQKITKLRLEKNNEFAIKEVFDTETFKDNAIVLKEVVELLQTYQIRYAEKQPFLGDFFELLLTTGLKQESGQFFTPVPVARFICKSIPLDRIIQSKLDAGDASDLLPATIDYAAGSGHFLTESMEEIQNIIHQIDESKLRPNVAKEIRKRQSATFDRASEYMYGIEKDYRLVKTAKVGCYLHGDGIATVIHGDGLDSFSQSKHYRLKLKNDPNKEDQQLNEQFDLVLSNPPYSVSAFKGNLDREKAEKDFDLYQYLTDRSSEIECLFIERTKQLLKEGGIASLILPSSILSNSGIYTKAREILLRDFDILSIVSLGSGTFMATGTNTVVLFMKKRHKYFSRNLEASINKFFTNLVDVSLNGIEQVFSKYTSDIWGVSLEDYKTLCQGSPNTTIQSTELYQDYSKKLKVTHIQKLTDMIVQIEKEKVLYFVLSYNQQVVLVKSGEKQVEKEFLGYEFSARKGSEGIHPIQGGKLIDDCTKLFDPERLDNDAKVSTYIYDAFNGRDDRPIHEDLTAHISRTRLVNLITFDRVDFEKTISTNVKKKMGIISRYPLVKIGSIAKELYAGGDVPEGNYIKGTTSTEEYQIPIFSNGIENNGLYGFTNIAKVVDSCITISARGTIGFPIERNQPFYPIVRLLVLIPKRELVMTKYLVYVIEKLELNHFGATTPQLTVPQISGFAIPLPPLDIQQQIVDEIGVLEKKAKEHKENVEELKGGIEKIISSIEGEKYTIKNMCLLNPSKKEINDISKDTIISFIEMSSVSNNGFIERKVDKHLGELKKGSYTYFREGDIILAKITPCMENGKCALAQNLTNNLGMGSSEFHVIRCNNQINNKFLFTFLNRDEIRKEAEKNMTGASGHKRVPISFYEALQIPLPPLKVQQQIVAEIEAIEAQMALLEVQLAQISGLKQAILTKYL